MRLLSVRRMLGDLSITMDVPRGMRDGALGRAGHPRLQTDGVVLEREGRPFANPTK